MKYDLLQMIHLEFFCAASKALAVEVPAAKALCLLETSKMLDIISKDILSLAERADEVSEEEKKKRMLFSLL